MSEKSFNSVPSTAEDLRARKGRDNRHLLLILLAVCGLFGSGAFGMALLVVYGPF
ncbi:MAG: hypothetical protein ACNS61_13680 [Candidatus Wenzhouxiangella sp. M2_3B_020]